MTQCDGRAVAPKAHGFWSLLTLLVRITITSIYLPYVGRHKCTHISHARGLTYLMYRKSRVKARSRRGSESAHAFKTLSLFVEYTHRRREEALLLPLLTCESYIPVLLISLLLLRHEEERIEPLLQHAQAIAGVVARGIHDLHNVKPAPRDVEQ